MSNKSKSPSGYSPPPAPWAKIHSGKQKKKCMNPECKSDLNTSTKAFCKECHKQCDINSCDQNTDYCEAYTIYDAEEITREITATPPTYQPTRKGKGRARSESPIASNDAYAPSQKVDNEEAALTEEGKRQKLRHLRSQTRSLKELERWGVTTGESSTTGDNFKANATNNSNPPNTLDSNPYSYYSQIQLKDGKYNPYLDPAASSLQIQLPSTFRDSNKTTSFISTRESTPTDLTPEMNPTTGTPQTYQLITTPAGPIMRKTSNIQSTSYLSSLSSSHFTKLIDVMTGEFVRYSLIKQTLSQRQIEGPEPTTNRDQSPDPITSKQYDATHSMEHIKRGNTKSKPIIINLTPNEVHLSRHAPSNTATSNIPISSTNSNATRNEYGEYKSWEHMIGPTSYETKNKPDDASKEEFYSWIAKSGLYPIPLWHQHRTISYLRYRMKSNCTNLGEKWKRWAKRQGIDLSPKTTSHTNVAHSDDNNAPTEILEHHQNFVFTDYHIDPRDIETVMTRTQDPSLPPNSFVQPLTEEQRNMARQLTLNRLHQEGKIISTEQQDIDAISHISLTPQPTYSTILAVPVPNIIGKAASDPGTSNKLESLPDVEMGEDHNSLPRPHDKSNDQRIQELVHIIEDIKRRHQMDIQRLQLQIDQLQAKSRTEAALRQSGFETARPKQQGRFSFPHNTYPGLSTAPPPVPTHTRPQQRTRGNPSPKPQQQKQPTQPSKPKIYGYKERQLIVGKNIGSTENDKITEVDEKVKLRNEIAVRDIINKALRNADAPPSLKIMSVQMNAKGNYSCLTSEQHSSQEMNPYCPNIFKALKAWEKEILAVRVNQVWSKVVVHSVSTEYFMDNDLGMAALRNEIEEYNEVKLVTLPRFLTKPEKREGKTRSSIVLAVGSKEEASLLKKNGTLINNRIHVTNTFIDNNPREQCTKCLRFGHTNARCHEEPRCRLCSEEHLTNHHRCNICPTQGRRCQHTKLQCANCGESHVANHPACDYVKENRKSQPNPTRQLGPLAGE
jgi:hypothetical protein